MLIHVSKDGAPLGQFAEEEVRAKLANGEVSSTDLAWHEGMAEWQPLSSVLSLRDRASEPPPFVPPVSTQNPFAAPAAIPTSQLPSATSGLAVASLVCGILGFITCGLTGLPAIIMGHIAKSQINRSGGALTGGGLAVGGLVTGYFSFLIVFLAVVASVVVPSYNLIQQQADQMKGAANCKQIASLLLAYAADNNSLYPDSVTSPVTGSTPPTSNDAFRALFQEGLTKEESIFGCPASKFLPDKNIGKAPVFEAALMPGENHWAMTQGISSTSPAIMPLVFENPVETSWPPKWNADAAGRPVAGRAWGGGKIIVGHNDGSVETIKLESSRGGAVGARLFGNGKDPFNLASDGEPQKVLNIATSGGTGPFSDPILSPEVPQGLPPPPATR